MTKRRIPHLRIRIALTVVAAFVAVALRHYQHRAASNGGSQVHIVLVTQPTLRVGGPFEPKVTRDQGTSATSNLQSGVVGSVNYKRAR